MDAKLLEGAAGGLSERLVAALASPPFAFLGVGLVAWLWRRGWGRGWAELTDWIGRWSTADAVVLIATSLLIVLLLGSLANAVSIPVIRVLEGYWPSWLGPVARPLARRQARRVRRLDKEFQRTSAVSLSDVRGRSAWNSTRAEDAMARYPVEEHLLLPTRLGNTLRASELRPYFKYGLDPVRCWFQLWLVLPESTRNEISAARARLDAAAVAFTFSVAVAVWAVWAWWALPLALAAAAICYRVYAVPAAAAYGDLIEAACDVHRPALYAALRLGLPESPSADRELGTFVNAYLQRGAAGDQRIFR